jgi:hypothetical protein
VRHVLSMLGFFAFASCNSDVRPFAVIEGAPVVESACTPRDACILIEDDCGCARGGRRAAVAQSVAANAFSPGEACADVPSTEPFCTEANGALCLDGACVLIRTE